MVIKLEEIMFFGIALIVLGVLLLLSQLGIIHGSFWSYFWPVLVIAVGIRLVVGDKRKSG
jgi:hypothetical protein